MMMMMTVVVVVVLRVFRYSHISLLLIISVSMNNYDNRQPPFHFPFQTANTDDLIRDT